MKQAKKALNNLPEMVKRNDVKKKDKRVIRKPTEEYLENPTRFDVKGLDDGSKKAIKRYNKKNKNDIITIEEIKKQALNYSRRKQKEEIRKPIETRIIRNLSKINSLNNKIEEGLYYVDGLKYQLDKENLNKSDPYENKIDKLANLEIKKGMNKIRRLSNEMKKLEETNKNLKKKLSQLTK